MIEEIGEEGYNHLKDTLGFGDIIENGHASEDNPRRVSIVVRVREHSINCTNGVEFWDLVFSMLSRIKIHGNTLNDNYEKIKNARNESGSVQKP
jgi:hypothetical protein